MLEKSIEQKLREGIKKRIPNAECLKLVTPGFTGIPDRMILIPGGTVIFVELKRPGKKERCRQTFVQDWLRRIGFMVFSTVDSVEKVERIISYCARRCPHYMMEGEEL